MTLPSPNEIARLRELIDIIVDETGVDTFCANDPDDESVGVRTGADGAPVPLPMTFGHVRRARQALDKTAERVNALEAENKRLREEVRVAASVAMDLATPTPVDASRKPIIDAVEEWVNRRGGDATIDEIASCLFEAAVKAGWLAAPVPN